MFVSAPKLTVYSTPAETVIEGLYWVMNITELCPVGIVVFDEIVVGFVNPTPITDVEDTISCA